MFYRLYDAIDRILKYSLIGLVYGYQYGLRAFLCLGTQQTCCRFYPSCSEYALSALRQKGSQGIILIIKRIMRCHPFHPGGFDPVSEMFVDKVK